MSTVRRVSARRAPQRRRDRHQAAQLAMRAGLGRERHRAHIGEVEQPARQLLHQRERALHRRLRLQRMNIGEAFEPRHFLVEPRIMLHRAGAERIEPRIDRIILARQPHIMANSLRLREARQADRRLALQRAEA